MQPDFLTYTRWGIQLCLLISIILSSFFLAGTTTPGSAVRNLYAIQMWYTTAATISSQELSTSSTRVHVPASGTSGAMTITASPSTSTTTITGRRTTTIPAETSNTREERATTESTTTAPAPTIVKRSDEGYAITALQPAFVNVPRPVIKKLKTKEQEVSIHLKRALEDLPYYYNPTGESAIAHVDPPKPVGNYRSWITEHAEKVAEELMKDAKVQPKVARRDQLNSHPEIDIVQPEDPEVTSTGSDKSNEDDPTLNDILWKRESDSNTVNNTVSEADMTVLVSFYGICVSLNNASHVCTNRRASTIGMLAEMLYPSTSNSTLDSTADPLSLLAVALSLQKVLSPVAAIFAILSTGLALLGAIYTSYFDGTPHFATATLLTSLTATLFAAHAVTVLSSVSHTAHTILATADPTTQGLTIASEAGPHAVGLGIAAASFAALATLGLMLLDRIPSYLGDTDYTDSTYTSQHPMSRTSTSSNASSRKHQLEFEGYTIPPGGTINQARPNPKAHVRTMPRTMMSRGNWDLPSEHGTPKVPASAAPWNAV